MNKKIVIYLIITTVFLGTLFLMWCKGKKEEVLNIIYTLMISAEGLLGTKEGKAKLENVLKSYREKVEKLPKFTKLFVQLIFPEEKIRTYIKTFLPKINEAFRKKYKLEEDYIIKVKKLAFKEGKKLVINKIEEKGLGEKISLLSIDKESNINIKGEKRGVIKGFAELETDFRKANLKAGVEALYTF